MIVMSLDVVCDDCGDVIEHAAVGRSPIGRTALARAAELGWTRRRRPYMVVDLCAQCSKGPRETWRRRAAT